MLHLHLFGAVSFSIDVAAGGTGAHTRVSGRPGCLLAYLALARGRYFSRAELVSMLWGDQSASVGTFNTVLWRLRKQLERPPLALGALIACDRRGAVGLQPQAAVELDVEAFARSVLPALAKPLERMTEGDVDALRNGIELYTADILTELGDEWALREREKHRRYYLNALGRMMQMCAAAHDDGAAIRYAQAILDHDALREDVHRELMRLFLRSGQRAMALRQFELCRNALKRELAIQPMAETLALYQGIAHDAVTASDSGRTAAIPAWAMVERDAFASDPLIADDVRGLSARELVESARRHLARAEAQLQLSLPLL
jgi:DNA-binding SARP family transcriptional activator